MSLAACAQKRHSGLSLAKHLKWTLDWGQLATCPSGFSVPASHGTSTFRPYCTQAATSNQQPADKTGRQWQGRKQARQTNRLTLPATSSASRYVVTTPHYYVCTSLAYQPMCVRLTLLLLLLVASCRAVRAGQDPDGSPTVRPTAPFANAAPAASDGRVIWTRGMASLQSTSLISQVFLKISMTLRGPYPG